MLLTCVKAFGLTEPGDEVEVPDGAAFDPEHWQAAAGPPPAAVTPPGPASPPVPAAFPSDPPKEEM